MRRNKVFIAIVILLVLGLGVFAEYQRRTRDIEFEVPALTFFEDTHDISNYSIAYEDQQFNLIVYDMLRKTRTTIRHDIDDPSYSFSYPWILWKDPNGVSAHDLRCSKSFWCGVGDNPELSASNESIAVWAFGVGKIIGYDLENKTAFPIWEDQGKGNKFGDWFVRVISYPPNPMIDGNLVVWSLGAAGNYQVVVKNLTTQKLITIQTEGGEIWSVRVSDPYIVWKELEDSGEALEWNSSIITYDIRSGEIKTIKTAVDSFYDLDISGDIIVWDEKRNGATSDIYGYKLKTGREFPICVAREDQLYPRISGNTVIWHDARPQGWLSKLLGKESGSLRGKTFRHWPGEED